jgi:hypothetical protein
MNVILIQSNIGHKGILGTKWQSNLHLFYSLILVTSKLSFLLSNFHGKMLSPT